VQGVVSGEWNCVECKRLLQVAITVFSRRREATRIDGMTGGRQLLYKVMAQLITSFAVTPHHMNA